MTAGRVACESGTPVPIIGGKLKMGVNHGFVQVDEKAVKCGVQALGQGFREVQKGGVLGLRRGVVALLGEADSRHAP
ncbi:hypothetical protein CG51_03485 [Haematobacter missouriensis]|uniref:Uncharacterized protein n=1 Tax=Haematobacter missouriensis TaxID=366616 RepID=A0A212AWT9_9RHOB|nr:hypothetical protein CG51_03485 [Haematobacter missouriensis]OWJ71282.1 hypothetical protein CDV53_18975 [Haematobacter missouriensis]OWJ85941.1 hypothetical protein CDV52_01895 [Haematobacter missouriensis]